MKSSEFKFHAYLFIISLAFFLVIAVTICSLPKPKDDQLEQPIQKISHINDYLQKLQMFVEKINQNYNYKIDKCTMENVNSLSKLNPFLIGEDGRLNENNLRRMNEVILKIYYEIEKESQKIKEIQLKEEFNELEKIVTALTAVLGDLQNKC